MNPGDTNCSRRLVTSFGLSTWFVAGLGLGQSSWFFGSPVPQIFGASAEQVVT